MATVVQDLVTKFSFLGSDAPLKDYNQSLGGSIKLLGGMLLGLEAAAGAFTYWADGVLTGVDAVGQLRKETGVAVARIQELNYIAGQTQSTSAAVDSTLRSLSSTIGSAAQKGSEDFARLGISVRDMNGEVKNADVILDEVGQRFKALGLSLEEQKTFAGALGIDSSLLQMMGKTSSEMAVMRDRARELGTLTAEQTEQAELYKQSLNSMRFGLNSVKQMIAIGVAPELSNMAEGFTKLLADNKDWIIGGIQFTVRWVGNLLEAFHRLLPFFAIVGAGFLAMKVAALGFGGAMALVLSPIVLITAGVVALLLIVDDLIVAFSGGQSVIADFFKEFLGVDIVDALTKSFNFLVDNAINPVIDTLTSLWGLWQKLVGGIVSGGAKIADFFGFGDADVDPKITAAAANIPVGTGAAPAGGGSTSNQVTQNIDMNIVAGDPQATGNAVQDGLQRQLDNANTQLGVGGM